MNDDNAPRAITLNDTEVVIDEELDRALAFLQYRDSGMTNEEIGAVFGKHRSTVQRWIKEWTATGMMAQAQAIHLQPKRDKAAAATAAAYARLPGMIKHLADIAEGFTVMVDEDGKETKRSVSPHSSLEAFVVLDQHVFAPFLAEQGGRDDRASGYADRTEALGRLIDPIAEVLNRIARR